MSMVMLDTAPTLVMTDTAPVEAWTFGGVDTLNGTQIPDAYFDEVMAPLGPSAFTVLMYVSRRTFGFKRHSDQISLDQICHGIVTTEVRDADGTVIKPARHLDHGTGLAKSTVVRALDRLIAAGLIRKRHNTDPHRGQLANTYGIVFKDAAAVTPASPSLRDTRTVPAQETASPSSRPVSSRDTPCRVMTQAPVADLDTQQTVETTNSRRQTEISKREARVRHVNPSLDSTDSTTLTTEDTATRTLAGHMTSPVGEHVARLSAEFGDDAPRASRTRVLNIQGAAGLDEAATLALLDEAAAITRSQAVAITKRGRAGGVVRMPYLLATLQGLVEGPISDVGAAALAWPPALDPPATAAVTGVDDPPATTAAEAVWRAVRGELRRDLTPENYARWVEATTTAGLDGGLLHVGVPDEAHRQWLEHKLRGCVERALGRAGHGAVRVVYDIALPEEGAASGDQTQDQGIALAPPTDHGAALAPLDAAPVVLSSSALSPAPLAKAAPTGPPTSPTRAAQPPVVACPCCRAMPCRCRFGDQLRRVLTGRANGVAVGVPRASPWPSPMRPACAWHGSR